MSKKLILFIFLIFQTNVYAYTAFVPGITDLPVPAHFHLITGSDSTYYDNSGRLVQASFKGRSSEDNVIKFYKDTLPTLGWTRKGELQYVRDHEVLLISLSLLKSERKTDVLELNFLLKPY